MNDEVWSLFKAWAAISVAFAILLGGSRSAPDFAVALGVSAFTVGLGFVAHEGAHKLAAQRYGCRAQFKSFDGMLFLALLMSFAGFLVAAPGAVVMSCELPKSKRGKVAASGIAANLIVATLFWTSKTIVPAGFAQDVAGYGMAINAWLALFNLIPFGGFDGAKVLGWDARAYAAMAAFAVLFLTS